MKHERCEMWILSVDHKRTRNSRRRHRIAVLFHEWRWFTIKPSTASVRIISSVCSVGEVRHSLAVIYTFNRVICGLKMKVFVILSVLAVGAIGARLDNTYIPPANAQSAGGFNLDVPRVAQASNAQQTYAAPSGGQVQTQYQQQSHSQPGASQGTFTAISQGNGFQAVSAASHSAQGNGYQQQSTYQAPQQNYRQQNNQPAYQQQQSSYQQPQKNAYQQTGYNQASTTPIPILECKNRCEIVMRKVWKRTLLLELMKIVKLV